jgi:hypothetical protein
VVCEFNEDALKRLKTSSADIRRYMGDRGYDLFMLHADGHLPTLLPSGTKLVSHAPNLNVLFSTLSAVSAAYPEVVVQYVPDRS